MVTGDKTEVRGRNNILSDKDITISYEPISLTENIRMQIRKIQIKDNKAKLTLIINETDVDKNIKDTTPLKYKVYDSNNALLCNQESSKREKEALEYTDELILNNFASDTGTFTLEVYSKNNTILNKITVNINTREIAVEGESEELKRISESELKKYLGYITELEEDMEYYLNRKNDNDFGSFEDSKISIAEQIFLDIKQNNGKSNNNEMVYEVSEVNNMLESLGYEKIQVSFKKDSQFEIINRNGVKCFNALLEDTDSSIVGNTILEIKDISYLSGVYTVNFTYAFIPEEDSFDVDYSELEIKEATISLKLNENDKYSKFKVVEYVGENISQKNENYINNGDDENIELNQYFVGEWQNLGDSHDHYYITSDGNFLHYDSEGNLIGEGWYEVEASEDAELYITLQYVTQQYIVRFHKIDGDREDDTNSYLESEYVQGRMYEKVQGEG